MLRLWVTLHVLSAVALFGPTFAFPFMAMAMEKGGDRKTIITTMHGIAKRLVIPADFIMPLTGALIIISSHDTYNPFHKQNRWLLSAIVLFIVMFVIGNAVQMPSMSRASRLLETDPTNPELAKIAARQKKVGPVLGILLVVIVILMAAKPGI